MWTLTKLKILLKPFRTKTRCCQCVNYRRCLSKLGTCKATGLLTRADQVADGCEYLIPKTTIHHEN